MTSPTSHSPPPTLPDAHPHPALPVFLITFAVYAALVPWMVRVWQRTGDEPHYLLAAHSLAFDGDFDLNNNYAARDYLSFYGTSNLTPHTRPSPNGQAVLTHNLGLSILLAPAYRLGGFVAVEYFLAGLGALLAANVFSLGYQLTHNWLAAAIGWIAISFTPPVLWYVFLIYPEMLAGLCILIVLRHLLYTLSPAPLFPCPHPASREAFRGAFLLPSSLHLASCALCLAFLPWLSARYLPVFGLLVAAAALRAIKGRSHGWVFVLLGGLVGFGSYMLFSLWLYGNASPAASYAGPTPLGAFALLRFARGLFGWLMDNQRGLFVNAPVYIAALWGGALLLRRKPIIGAGVLLPFALLLLSAAAWGGFWIGWEHGARFLVAALPPLGAGVAYLWAAGRRAVVVPLTAALLGLSLLVGRAVVAKPVTGIISSPIERLKPTLNLEAIIPAMAGYAFIEPERRVLPAGQSGIALRQVDMREFPFGWYTARLPLEAAGAASPDGREALRPDTPVASVKIFSPHGGNYFAQTVYGRDLSNGGFIFNFKSPLYDGWAFPPTVLVSSTGQADLSLGTLAIEPNQFYSLVLPALWLIGLTLVGAWVIRRAAEPQPLHFEWTRPLTIVCALAAALSLGWSLQPHPRTHAIADLERTVGSEVADSFAYKGKALEARPEAGQEAGMLAVTLPEIYAPRRYRLTVSLQALAAPDPNLSVADVRVFGSEVEKFAQRWDVVGADLPADGQYHHFSFEFENPRQQALTFILDYPATVGLRADVIVVAPRR